MSRVVSERIASDRAFAEAFFAAQCAHTRRYYLRTGDPRLSLMLGESVTSYAADVSVVGSAALGVLHLLLAELSVAISVHGRDLQRVGNHLAKAREQLEHTDNSAIAARGMIIWYWLSAISAKAGGDLRDYRTLLRESETDRWITRNADPIDYAPVGQVRQLNSLEAAISDADVRGALMTFRL